MGIHIITYIVKERTKVEDSIGSYSYLPTEEFKDFDGDRYAGDRDFVYTDDFEWEYIYDDEDKAWDSRFYQRPKDIDKAIGWIKANIVEGNQERLIDLMTAMKENEHLWIFISY